ncbi:MAG: PepSY-associated TM helix domain-containing protein [Verrucomicrobia bacterium]|nr:PepSY-associated TM helix domain-containing protein [Verrucomicrobiota bacterium]
MKRFYDWTRDLHLYVGLFLSPLVLVFAVSTVLLNHNWKTEPRRAAKTTAVPVQISGEIGSLDQAKRILAQLRVTGEINYVRHSANEQRLVIPVMKPGETTRVEVDLRAQTATAERQAEGLGAALIYLHKMPGPHLAKYRGNWIYNVFWAVFADATVWGMLFLTVTGLYLWWVLKAERAVGFVLLVAGVASFALLVIALSWPAQT